LPPLGIHSDYAATVNPYFEDFDGRNGALSAPLLKAPSFVLAAVRVQQLNLLW